MVLESRNHKSVNLQSEVSSLESGYTFLILTAGFFLVFVPSIIKNFTY